MSELPPYQLHEFGYYGGRCLVFESGDFVGRIDREANQYDRATVTYYWSTPLAAGPEVVALLRQHQDAGQPEPRHMLVHTQVNSGYRRLQPGQVLSQCAPPAGIDEIQTCHDEDAIAVSWVHANNFNHRPYHPMDPTLNRLQATYNRDIPQLQRIAELAARTGSFVVRRAVPRALHELY